MINRMRNRGFHGALPEEMQPPVFVVAVGIIQAIMGAAAFGAGVGGGRDQLSAEIFLTEDSLTAAGKQLNLLIDGDRHWRGGILETGRDCSK